MTFVTKDSYVVEMNSEKEVFEKHFWKPADVMPGLLWIPHLHSILTLWEVRTKISLSFLLAGRLDLDELLIEIQLER